MGEKLYNYDDIDYSEMIKKAEEDNQPLLAAEYEKIRNQKIDDMGLDYAKTYKYNTEPAAESSSGTGTASTENKSSANQTTANKSSSSGGWTSKLSNYDDSIDDLYDSIANRDAFSYDYTEDPLYQQYADQYTTLGNQAMQDTLGQVSARTGGLASSYAGSASQGAYNSYMQQLANKIPELYQLAYSMYQDEGDRQYQNLEALRGLQSDELSQYNTDRAYNYGVYSDNWNRNYQTKQYESEQAQQTQENTWYEEQVARGINENALQAAMSNSLTQSEREEKKEQYQKTGKGGAEVANYETYFDYMTGLTDYYAEQLR